MHHKSENKISKVFNLKNLGSDINCKHKICNMLYVIWKKFNSELKLNNNISDLQCISFDVIWKELYEIYRDTIFESKTHYISI